MYLPFPSRTGNIFNFIKSEAFDAVDDSKEIKERKEKHEDDGPVLVLHPSTITCNNNNLEWELYLPFPSWTGNIFNFITSEAFDGVDDSKEFK